MGNASGNAGKAGTGSSRSASLGRGLVELLFFRALRCPGDADEAEDWLESEYLLADIEGRPELLLMNSLAESSLSIPKLLLGSVDAKLLEGELIID